MLRNSTAEMLLAMGIGTRSVWRGARHAERKFAPLLNVNTPLR